MQAPLSESIVSVSVIDGQVAVSPDPLQVQGEDHCLSFQLVTPGYSFPTLGAIVIEGGHKTQFPEPPVWVDAQTVTLRDRNCNRTPRSYKYTVVVLDSRGRRHTLDPEIVNEGTPRMAEA
ncbi:MAG: hypothetical protein KBC73_01055 [Burkholderiaceae bacterium]|nr:hypothetical protein [Burkholderiaceae bacterium]